MWGLRGQNFLILKTVDHWRSKALLNYKKKELHQKLLILTKKTIRTKTTCQKC